MFSIASAGHLARHNVHHTIACRGNFAMGFSRRVVIRATAVLAISFVEINAAELPTSDLVAISLDKMATGQQMLKLPVHVTDATGKPVSRTKITPWALRSSQGHGLWAKDDKQAGMGPKEVITDESGNATVMYPLYRDVQEQIRTIGASIYVDHPDFAYIESLHIELPIETKGPYEIKLTAGVSLEIRTLIDGMPVDLDNVFALWSDGRSWRPDAKPKKLANGVLRIPTMPPGKNSVLLVKLDGDRATHFSKITNVELKSGERNKIDVALRPSREIRGRLSDNVPRPVLHGRIKVSTLAPNENDDSRVTWFSWSPIRPDGTFTINGWPDGERLQLIALCDGYIAVSGSSSDAGKQPSSSNGAGLVRPQVFDPSRDEQIEVAMAPLVRCQVNGIDENDRPIGGVAIYSCPNVTWWNQRSQIYCHPLVRGERLLRDRNYDKSVDKAYSTPFEGETDSEGKLALYLPTGTQRLNVSSDRYELPALLGDRDIRVKLTRGETTEVLLRLQPRGTEKLGEWDQLAGVVFGCATRDGQRICASPVVRKQMADFAKRFHEAKDPHDPKLLAEVYSAVADAFVGAGDPTEAAKWRQKATEEMAKVTGAAQKSEANK